MENLNINSDNLQNKDMQFILWILDTFKNIKLENIDKEIDLKISNYIWKWDIIKWFIDFFEDLETNEPKNDFKLMISRRYPYFWKNVLVKILWKIEIKETSNGYENTILDVLEAREISLSGWALVHETWPINSDNLIINLPVFLSDNPWSLADGFISNWKESWFTSFWWWRSSYTKSLENLHSWKQNDSLLWYLKYPENWLFEKSVILDSLVEEIEKKGVKNISIHWASMWWKLALDLVLKLADKWIKINKLFINWWALTPEHLKIPWVEQEISLYKWKSPEELKALKSTLSWVEAMVVKLLWFSKYYTIQLAQNTIGQYDGEFNKKDKKYWDRVNKWEGVSIFQLLNRLNYLKENIDFVSQSKILEENVWEVIAINSIPKQWAESDWMVSTKFPEYLEIIFWEKLRTVNVEWVWHYMVPNTPWLYAKELNWKIGLFKTK